MGKGASFWGSGENKETSNKDGRPNAYPGKKEGMASEFKSPPGDGGRAGEETEVENEGQPKKR